MGLGEEQGSIPCASFPAKPNETSIRNFAVTLSDVTARNKQQQKKRIAKLWLTKKQARNRIRPVAQARKKAATLQKQAVAAGSCSTPASMTVRAITSIPTGSISPAGGAAR